MPKLDEGHSRNGHRFYFIGCPNYCWVLKPQKKEDMWRNVAWLSFNEDLDANALYKRWNEALVEENKNA